MIFRIRFLISRLDKIVFLCYIESVFNVQQGEKSATDCCYDLWDLRGGKRRPLGAREGPLGRPASLPPEDRDAVSSEKGKAAIALTHHTSKARPLNSKGRAFVIKNLSVIA